MLRANVLHSCDLASAFLPEVFPRITNLVRWKISPVNAAFLSFLSFNHDAYRFFDFRPIESLTGTLTRPCCDVTVKRTARSRAAELSIRSQTIEATPVRAALLSTRDPRPSCWWSFDRRRLTPPRCS